MQQRLQGPAQAVLASCWPAVYDPTNVHLKVNSDKTALQCASYRSEVTVKGCLPTLYQTLQHQAAGAP